MNEFSLKDEIALITGGGSGLGFGVARCFVKAGARVVLVGRTEERLRAAVGELGEAASYQVFDVTQVDEAPRLVTSITQQVGTISILVNNAGIHIKKEAAETTVEDFERILQTHVLGAFALTRTVMPGMKNRGAGVVLFMASMASFLGISQVLSYATAKAGYLGMVRTLAVELASYGIRVNAIAPGWIESNMARRALAEDPERERKVLSRIPMAHLGQPEDVGWAAVYLCSPAARYVTGVVLPVDGGVLHSF
jgi:NAD(P)-dependent dehydrogenase (short-subunit alcohol dehydrogenase family)